MRGSCRADFRCNYAMYAVRLGIILIILGLQRILAEENDPVCPHRCLCFKTTVRCMFLQLEKVPDIPPEATILDLRFNKIKEISANTFKNLAKLNTLLLNNNHITRIENDAFAGLSELRYLYLYKNRIKSIDGDAFTGLHKLEQLYIHFNKIEKIEKNTFADLPVLERLFLHNNYLYRIPHGTFEKLKSLRRLRLDSNSLICDCQLMWLVQMLQENRGTLHAAATCEYPESVQGKPLISLSVEDFLCKMPKLTEEPNDVDATPGSTAYFTCKADGDPKPDIVWLHNSNEILPEADGRYSILTDGTLMITETKDLDEGIYECMAKNPAGEIKSRAAKMYYHEKRGKLTFTNRPTDHKVPIGSTIVLPCKAVGRTPPEIRWTHNDSDVDSTGRYHLSPTGTLSIKNAQRTDSGIFHCIASDNESEVSTAVKVIVQAPPTFLERPRDQEAIEGNNVDLICIVEGYPTPKLTWTKDGAPIKTSGRVRHNGTVFSIREVRKSDEGIYVCHASNDAGERNSSALLMIREKVPPVFITIPEDQVVPSGSSVELPCRARGQPMPAIRWKKDGNYLTTDNSHRRISPHGVLYMFGITEQDEGVYECIAENGVGFASISVRLTVGEGSALRYPGNRYVVPALEEAKREVERALNHTLDELFGEPHKRSPAELMEVFRFPSTEAQEMARAADIYERALEIVWDHVQSRPQFNVSEFSYQNIVSPAHLELMANLSGCLVHKQPVSCSNICFHRKYRTFDGTCNNLENKLWGSSLSSFVRLLPATYENGFNMPVGWSGSHLYNGYRKPSARLVSMEVVSADSVSQDSQFSHMLMQWGQFLDHDLDFSMPAISHARYVDGVNCATSCDYTPPCFPIEVPRKDHRSRTHRCMEFVRSSTLCGSGMTSVFFNQVQHREQVNQLTAFIDASNVYGSNERLSRHLRNRTSSRGLLRHGPRFNGGKHLLPFNDGQPIDCKRDLSESSIDCFLAGDVRANEQLGLLAMHTLWMREHNRIASELYSYNPHWSDDKLYHEARKIVGAVMQHITYTHWIPKILGSRTSLLVGEYGGYDPSVNPSISNVFATAALRFGHTLINPELLRLNESYRPIPQGNIPLRKAFFAPFRLVEEGGVDPLLRGLIYAPAKLKRPDQLLNSDLTEHLFTPAHLIAQDLAALNIQRGRDHGLPSYNEWRKFCNLTVAQTFEGFSSEISDLGLRRKIEELYHHPDNVDLWVGGISEDPIDGGKIGPTFQCLLADQFRRLRSGDRFWYENPGVFTPEQLKQIKQSSLGRVLCDSGDNITRVTKDVFLVPQIQEPNFVDCSSLPKLDLKMWIECCEECGLSRTESESPEFHYRRKRSSGYDELPEERHIDSQSFNNTASTSNENLVKVLYKQEKDFDITEQRIEGIEELVGRLEHAVKKLTRKVKRLEAECRKISNGGCSDSSGKKRKNGEKWRKDKCTLCQCEENQVTCWVETCSNLLCKQPKYIEGQCCPIC